MPVFFMLFVIIAVAGGLGALFLILAVKTPFTATRVLGFIGAGLLLLGGLGGGVCLMSERIPFAIAAMFFLLAGIGLLVGTVGYFMRGLGFYNKDKADTALLIKAVRGIWWPVVVWQLILGILALIITSYEALDGGSYGSGPIVGIPGIVLGLVFFGQLIKKKAWAGIALGILGALGVLIGLISLVSAANAELEGAGVVFLVLGCLFSMGWGVVLVVIGFFSRRIKAYVKEGGAAPGGPAAG